MSTCTYNTLAVCTHTYALQYSYFFFAQLVIGLENPADLQKVLQNILRILKDARNFPYYCNMAASAAPKTFETLQFLTDVYKLKYQYTDRILAGVRWIFPRSWMFRFSCSLAAFEAFSRKQTKPNLTEKNSGSLQSNKLNPT